ncbi:hypothetical protein V6N13_081172 [Hibiscus sabdariffa]
MNKGALILPTYVSTLVSKKDASSNRELIELGYVEPPHDILGGLKLHYVLKSKVGMALSMIEHQIGPPPRYRF